MYTQQRKRCSSFNPNAKRDPSRGQDDAERASFPPGRQFVSFSLYLFTPRFSYLPSSSFSSSREREREREKERGWCFFEGTTPLKLALSVSRGLRGDRRFLLILLFNLREDAIFFLISSLTILGDGEEGAMVRERRRGLRGGKDASVIDLSPVCVSTQLGNSIYRNDTPPSLSRSIRCFCEISTANGFNPNELRFRNLPPPCFSKVKWFESKDQNSKRLFSFLFLVEEFIF